MDRRAGTRNLGTLPPDSQVAVAFGKVVVVHPNGPPFSVDPETGQREILRVVDGCPVIEVAVGPETLTYSTGLTA